MSNAVQKPCIECGKECDILPVQLGDLFTLTYLRVCSAECVFTITYEYLYEIGYHKDFRNKLYDSQNEEDKKLRDEFIDLSTKEFLERFRESLDANSNLLSTPAPESITKMFSGKTAVSHGSSCTMRFTRPSKEDLIEWQKQHVNGLSSMLEEAVEDLKKMELESR